MDSHRMRVENELRIEKEMLGFGVRRYQHKVQKAEEYQRAAESGGIPVVKKMLSQAIIPVAERIEKFVEEKTAQKRGRRVIAAWKLKDTDPKLVAFIAAQKILNCIPQAIPLTRAARDIGHAIELEQRMAAWEKYSKGHAPEGKLSKYEGMIAFQMKKMKGRGHKERVVIHTMNKEGFDWKAWTQPERIHVGSALVLIFQEATGWIDVEQVTIDARAGRSKSANKQQHHIVPTDTVLKHLEESHEFHQLLCPTYLPMVVPPKPWERTVGGGYLFDVLEPLRLVKGARRAYLEELESVDLSKVYAALNALQDTPWRINKRVLDVMMQYYDHQGAKGLPDKDPIEVPSKPVNIDTDEEARLKWRREAAKVHTENYVRKTQRFQGLKVFFVARKYRNYERFYFPYQLDFRGRAYAVPQFLHPQGPDYAKALLELADGDPIEDAEAAKWLAVHGANMYGHDTVSLDERSVWVEEHEDLIVASANDPFECRWWLDADKPWQFLAWCLDWAGFRKAGYGYVSHARVEMDGSCNGLQHFSAMLRDEVGGEATNLTASEQPEDIYRLVAEKVADRLCEVRFDADTEEGKENEAFRRGWLQFGIDRYTTKRSVMTLPYGSTLRACGQFIHDDMQEKMKDGMVNPFGERTFKAATFLSRFVWDAIGETVIKAREAMDWLKDAARKASKLDLPIHWTTPTGFEVMQAYPDVRRTQLQTRIGDRIIYMDYHVPKDGILDDQKQANGIAPNFVHSMDAAALMLTVVEASGQGVHSFAMVHDSYATTAARIADLARILRQVFVEMYEQNDVLQQFRDEIELLVGAENLEPLPAKGDLDLNTVLDSEFFFA